MFRLINRLLTAGSVALLLPCSLSVTASSGAFSLEVEPITFANELRGPTVHRHIFAGGDAPHTGALQIRLRVNQGFTQPINRGFLFEFTLSEGVMFADRQAFGVLVNTGNTDGDMNELDMPVLRADHFTLEQADASTPATIGVMQPRYVRDDNNAVPRARDGTAFFLVHTSAGSLQAGDALVFTIPGLWGLGIRDSASIEVSYMPEDVDAAGPITPSTWAAQSFPARQLLSFQDRFTLSIADGTSAEVDPAIPGHRELSSGGVDITVVTHTDADDNPVTGQVTGVRIADLSLQENEGVKGYEGTHDLPFTFDPVAPHHFLDRLRIRTEGGPLDPQDRVFVDFDDNKMYDGPEVIPSEHPSLLTVNNYYWLSPFLSATEPVPVYYLPRHGRFREGSWSVSAELDFAWYGRADKSVSVTNPTTVTLANNLQRIGTIGSVFNCAASEEVEVRLTNRHEGLGMWLFMDGYDQEGEYLGHRFADASFFRGSGAQTIAPRETLVLDQARLQGIFGFSPTDEDCMDGTADGTSTWNGLAELTFYSSGPVAIHSLTDTRGGDTLPWLTLD